jgi:hypothetical protein
MRETRPKETFASACFPKFKGKLLKRVMEDNRRQILIEEKVNLRWEWHDDPGICIKRAFRGLPRKGCLGNCPKQPLIAKHR